MCNRHPWNRLDLTGQKYGRLTVLGPAGAINGYGFWRCRCECGKEVTVRTTSLRSGNTRSCGCLAREHSRGRRLDLTGRKFGRLTVLEPAEHVGKDTAWRCRCECGKETVAKTRMLTSGDAKSCGCLRAAARGTAPGGT